MTRNASRGFMISLLLVVAAFVIVLFGYFFLISPKNDDASSFNDERDELQREYADIQAQLARVENQEADLPQLYRLAKAAPSTIDPAGVVLELTTLASESGVTVRSIQVGEQANGANYSGVPFDVVVGGDYATVTDFMEAVRNLVRVRSQKLSARGSLYQLREFSFDEGETGAPSIDATLKLNATGPAAPSADAASGAATSSGTGSDPSGDQPEGDSESEGNGG